MFPSTRTLGRYTCFPQTWKAVALTVEALESDVGPVAGDGLPNDRFK